MHINKEREREGENLKSIIWTNKYTHVHNEEIQYHCTL